MRGTTNRNVRGSAESRRRRRAWLIKTYASNVDGCCRCYRCGCLLTAGNDTFKFFEKEPGEYLAEPVWPLTVDRIVPGCRGGKYTRGNIRPACAHCNSETGGATRG